jgi:hypothetical protein
MSLTLDHKIFGNGHGMASPFFDATYYWIVDTLRSERAGRNGRLYAWIGGFGAQLRSFEWLTPKPGTRRRLAGREMVVFNTSRKGLRVDVSWALVDMPKGIDEMNAHLREFKKVLGSPFHD